MLRIVLDTNQFISAILKPQSNSAIILGLFHQQRLQLLISKSILTELRRVVFYPKLTKLHRRSPEWLEKFLVKIESISELIPENVKVDVIEKDPSDNMFLACALEGQADFIISGDQHLKDVLVFHRIPIVTPDVFLKRFEQDKLP